MATSKNTKSTNNTAVVKKTAVKKTAEVAKKTATKKATVKKIPTEKVEKVNKNTEEQKAPYKTIEPNKSYTWSPDSEFALNGNEFGLIYRFLDNVSVTGVNGANALLTIKQIFNSKLELGLNKGIVKEVEESPKQ